MLFIWFWLVAVMITAYVVLDGFDLGAGVLHLFIAKTDQERRTVLRTIGPVWDGNEVWLLAGGRPHCRPTPGHWCGTAMRSGCWLAAELCISPSRCFMLPASAVFICRL